MISDLLEIKAHLYKQTTKKKLRGDKFQLMANNEVNLVKRKFNKKNEIDTTIQREKIIYCYEILKVTSQYSFYISANIKMKNITFNDI